MRLPSPTPESTRAAARALAGAIDAGGLVLTLEGPLGAGKTCFVQGLAEGLGLAPERVTSPTFVLAQELPLADGRRLVHVDCYRVGSEAELEDAGLLDWLAPDAIVAVEWAERVPGAWPDERLALRIGRAGEGRVLEAAARGPRADRVLARWRARGA